MPKYFETTFLPLSATIAVLSGLFPTKKISNRKIIWVFPGTDEVYKAIDAFNSNLPVPVFDLTQMMSRFRAEMMALRKAESERENDGVA